ncbi:MAG: hypothetical protein KAH18_04860 [Psychromonas sp.]|nr:hypothetical protein [Psychromonas sp.]
MTTQFRINEQTKLRTLVDRVVDISEITLAACNKSESSRFPSLDELYENYDTKKRDTLKKLLNEVNDELHDSH